LLGHGQAVSSVTWVDNETVCSSGWDHCIRLWDLESGVNTTTLTGSGVLHCIAYSPLNGLLASGSSDRHVRLWDARAPDGRMVKMTLKSHTGWVSSVNWSRTSENELVSGSYDTTLRLWDTRTPKVPLFAMTSHEAKVLCLDWSQPQMIASGGADNQLHVHRTAR
jgi:ribosome biogenesis protein YTM1